VYVPFSPLPEPSSGSCSTGSQSISHWLDGRWWICELSRDQTSRQMASGVDGDALLGASAEVGKESAECDEAAAVGDDEDAVGRVGVGVPAQELVVAVLKAATWWRVEQVPVWLGWQSGPATLKWPPA
jgi:hypothetical protein